MSPSSLDLLCLATHIWLQKAEGDHLGSREDFAQACELQRQWDEMPTEALAQLRSLTVTQIGVQPAPQINLLDRLVLAMASAPEGARPTGLVCIRWTLDHGFDANRYNGVVTPVGLAGYTGQIDVLDLFREHGADLRLELSLEHARACGAEDLAGTTMLHRIALRPRHCQAAAAVMAYLVRQVPGSIRADAEGRTPLTDPDVPRFAKTVIEAALAPPLESIAAGGDC